MDAALCGSASKSSSVGLLVVTWTASCIVACGKDHCTGSTGIEAYYWPACQALLTKLIPWKKYNVENDICMNCEEKRTLSHVDKDVQK